MRNAARLAVAALSALILVTAARASDLCRDEQATEQIPPKDPAYCANLNSAMRHPGAVPLDQYERTLDDFISQYCHRRLANHWAMDKTVRDAGPFVATLAEGVWTGSEKATHAPVLIWYSPEMAELAGKIPRTRPYGAKPAAGSPRARSWSRRCTTPPQPPPAAYPIC